MGFDYAQPDKVQIVRFLDGLFFKIPCSGISKHGSNTPLTYPMDSNIFSSFCLVEKLIAHSINAKCEYA